MLPCLSVTVPFFNQKPGSWCCPEEYLFLLRPVLLGTDICTNKFWVETFPERIDGGPPFEGRRCSPACFFARPDETSFQIISHDEASRYRKSQGLSMADLVHSCLSSQTLDCLGDVLHFVWMLDADNRVGRDRIPG